MADEREPQASATSSTPRWKLILWGAVAVYAALFLLLNSSKQEVSFVFFSVNTRLIWLILLSMALGAVLGRIGPRWWRSRGK
ncbi:MAG TPA: hypothetical protein VH305_06070 [Gaiella sp.]